MGCSQVEGLRPDPQPPVALEQDAANPNQWSHLSPTYTALGDLLAEYPVGSYTRRGDMPSRRVNFLAGIFGAIRPSRIPSSRTGRPGKRSSRATWWSSSLRNCRPVDPLDEIDLGIICSDGWFVFGTGLFPSFTSFTVPGSVFQEVGSYTAVPIHRRFFRYEVSRSRCGYVRLDSRTETGFEVVPVPEPASLAALGAGALLLVRRRRRA